VSFLTVGAEVCSPSGPGRRAEEGEEHSPVRAGGGGRVDLRDERTQGGDQGTRQGPRPKGSESSGDSRRGERFEVLLFQITDRLVPRHEGGRVVFEVGAHATGAFGRRRIQIYREVRDPEGPTVQERPRASLERPQDRLGSAPQLHEPPRVGHGSEEAGVGEDRSTLGARSPRFSEATALLREETSFQEQELARGGVFQGGRRVEAVERLGERLPSEPASGRPDERRLSGPRAAFDRDQGSPTRHLPSAYHSAAHPKPCRPLPRVLFSPRNHPRPVPETPRSPSVRPRHPARVLEAETLAEIAREVERTESDPEGVGIMTRKGRIYPVRLDGISLKAAPLLKQETLSVGGDSAHARGIADHSVATTSVVLLATWGQYQRLLPKLRRQPFRLSEAADEIDHALRSYVTHSPRTIRGPHRAFVVGDHARVMGVLNVTPDSFSDGGKHLDPAEAVAHAVRMVADGADLIDIGGESTRPGATPVSPDAEWARIAPVLSGLAGRISVPVSVDTRHPEVAQKAVDAGADVVNDVEGLRSEAMRRTVATSGAAVIAMHMRGTPATMQTNLVYSDVRAEVFSTLAAATDLAVTEGVPAEKILIDPGLGFGKSAEQSLELLVHAGEFRSLGYPVVLGASRKSFLGWALGSDDPTSRLEAGLAAAVVAAERGVSLVRTHDVGATVRALALVRAAQKLANAPPAASSDLTATEPDG